MVGQGRPQQARKSRSFREQHLNRGLSRPSRVLTLICALWFGAACMAAEPLDLHIRLSWGNGDRRLWHGSISVNDGMLSEPRCLGIEADAPIALELDENTLRFSQRTAMTFDGIDVHVVAPQEATIAVELAPADQPSAAKKVELKLAEFVRAMAIVHDSPLDDRQNRLQVQRAPGDRLRVQFDRDSLVFSPGEEFVFQVLPHALGLPEGTAIRCTMELFSSGSDSALWKGEQVDLRVDGNGNAGPIGPVSLPLPTEEGVYEVLISMYQRKFSDALVPSKPLRQRMVQLIVIDNRPRAAETAEWQLIEEIDSANPNWWNRVMLLPRKLPGLAPKVPLGDKPLGTREYGGARMQEMGPGGWHAAPIPISHIGEPHILEFEYPCSIRQTVGISIVEPNAVGETQSLDSGIEVSGDTAATDFRIETHRLVFWPRTKTPWLVLTNRRDDTPAVIGKMRVFAGPLQLPSTPLAPIGSGQRLSAAYFDKPLFSDNFGAPEALDAPSHRSLRDWNTFYLGAVRLAEYLKYAGYNAAFVPVVNDGVTLYPTGLLESIPKWDNGTFFVTGQDPRPKDVLELLLRIFDREGLVLIPMVQFGTPLRELETIQHGAPSAFEGIPLVGALPNDIRPRPGAADSRRGLAPYYNPLDPRVQTAMRRVTSELLSRCGGHASFGGLALQLTSFGYAQLPDESWGLDASTFMRFARDVQIRVPEDESDPFTARLSLTRGPMRDPWLKWRAAQLNAFYRDLRLDVAQTSPSAALYLDLHELVAGRVVQSSMKPQLPARDNFGEALLRHGLDANLWGEKSGIVVLRPHGVAPLNSLPAQATNLELEQSKRVDDYFRTWGAVGALAFHEPQFFRVPGFDEANPFGTTKYPTRFAAHFSRAGVRARTQLVHNLVELDSSVLAAGGWMLPLGQEDALRPILQVLRQLPAERFQSVPSSSGDSSGVAVRVLSKEDKTYVYLANATGLSGNLELKMQALPPRVSVVMLSQRQPAALTRTTGGMWVARLEPYDLIAFVIGTRSAKISDWRIQFDRAHITTVERQVQELRARVSALREPRAIEVLENPGFEKPLQDGQIPGWSILERAGVTGSLDHRSLRSGNASLHFRVAGEGNIGVVRSNPIPLPRTSRLSIQARMRTSDANRQPPMRMAIEGRLADGTPFYTWSQPIGIAVDPRSLSPTNGPARPLPTEWTEDFVFHIVNLPAGTTGQLSINFEMLGPGEVWIDDVEVFDMYFDVVEQHELVKNVGHATMQLEEGKFTVCQRFLQGYWPRFVLEYAPAPTPRLSQNQPNSPPGTKSTAEPAPSKPEEKTSRWNKLPKPPFKIPSFF